MPGAYSYRLEAVSSDGAPQEFGPIGVLVELMRIFVP